MGSDVEDYLETMAGLMSGVNTEIDPSKPGDLQAFRDASAEQAERGVVIHCDDEDEDPRR
jgi:hypothetical protein